MVKNDFKKIAAPGKYEGVHTNGVKYEFYFTDTSAYKVIITLTDSSKVIYYGKGEAKDDGFRATGEPSGKSIKVRYQSGAVADVIKGEDKVYYKRAADGEYVELEKKEDINPFSPDLTGKKYAYSGKGLIENYGTDDRPMAGDKNNTAQNVKYELNFYANKKVFLSWEENNVKRFYDGDIKHAKGFKINAEFYEAEEAWQDGKPVQKPNAKKISRFMVFDPADTDILAIENAPLRKM